MKILVFERLTFACGGQVCQPHAQHLYTIKIIGTYRKFIGGTYEKFNKAIEKQNSTNDIDRILFNRSGIYQPDSAFIYGRYRKHRYPKHRY